MPKGKWDYPFLDRRFVAEDLDEPFLHELKKDDLKPVVFIQGLHRSGTTFLLNSLYDLYPAVSTSVYHIAFYRRLLYAEEKGETARYKLEIARYLERHDLRDRRIDAVPVAPESLDEYGFIYERLGVPRTATWLLREIRSKLSRLQPASRLILLKDPVCFSSSFLLRAAIPEAKFIFIHRNPQKILHSQFRAYLTKYVGHHTQEPYMVLLSGRTPSRYRMLSSYLLPKRVVRRKAAGFYFGSIRREIESYLRELPFLPRECYIDVEYEDLLDATEATLGRIVEFIGIEPDKPLSTVQPAPRAAPPLPPELVDVAENLSKSLSQMGYPYSGKRR